MILNPKDCSNPNTNSSSGLSGNVADNVFTTVPFGVLSGMFQFLGPVIVGGGLSVRAKKIIQLMRTVITQKVPNGVHN